MPRKSIISVFRGGSKAAAAASHDKRTQASTRREAAAVSSKYKAKEIAHFLGISYQKWGGIKKGIESGKIYSPEIRDKLKQIEKGEAKPPPSLPAPKPAPVVVVGPKIEYTLLEDTAYTEDSRGFRKNFPWAKEIKQFMNKTDLRNWLKKLGGKEYFMAVREESTAQPGNYLYKVYDIRTSGEMINKGHQKGEIRALKILRDNFELK